MQKTFTENLQQTQTFQSQLSNCNQVWLIQQSGVGYKVLLGLCRLESDRLSESTLETAGGKQLIVAMLSVTGASIFLSAPCVDN